jgi:hypothetical protein
MQLQEWLSRHNISHEGLAKFLHCSIFAVRKWISGEREPRWEMREKIAKLTKGEVSPNDWHENSRSCEAAVADHRKRGRRKRRAAA